MTSEYMRVALRPAGNCAERGADLFRPCLGQIGSGNALEFRCSMSLYSTFRGGWLLMARPPIAVNGSLELSPYMGMTIQLFSTATRHFDGGAMNLR